MAAKSFTGFIAIFVFILLLASLDKLKAEAKLQQRRSKTWTGLCRSSPRCERRCKEWEEAKYGACHFRFPGFACFCYYDYPANCKAN